MTLKHGLDLITLLNEPLGAAKVILPLIILVLLAIVFFSDRLRLMTHRIHRHDGLAPLDDRADGAVQSQRVIRKLVIPKSLLPRRLLIVWDKHYVVLLVSLWGSKGDSWVSNVVWVLYFLVGWCHRFQLTCNSFIHAQL